ncbi:MAG: TIGR03769 domain-containing protein [Pirellulales bacterium]|nr:TIGR03769 domain-containing protein [Pirellulales bacterium]
MHTPKSNLSILSTAFLFVLILSISTLSPATARAELTIPPHLITAHGGVGVPYINGQWDLKAVDGYTDPPVDFPADEALFYLNGNTAVSTDVIPAGFHAWMGTSPGQTIYVVSQTPQPDTPYFGFNLRGMTPADKDALAAWEPNDPRIEALHHEHEGEPGGGDEEEEAWIQIDLLAVRGLDGGAAPGEFSLWTFDDDTGATVWMSTAQTLEHGNKFYLDVEHGHSHVNWAFTAPGVYELELQATTYLASDPNTPIVSPPTCYYFGVLNPVPEPSSLALLATLLAAAIGLRFLRRR